MKVSESRPSVQPSIFRISHTPTGPFTSLLSMDSHTASPTWSTWMGGIVIDRVMESMGPSRAEVESLETGVDSRDDASLDRRLIGERGPSILWALPAMDNIVAKGEEIGRKWGW